MVGAPADGGTTTRDAGATAPLSVEITPESLELVAVGRGPTSKLVWLRTFGDRVWLSGTNVDAYTDDDGPLAKSRDLLEGLPYAGAVDRLWVAGRYPHLVVVRERPTPGFGSLPELAAFVRVGLQWSPANRLRLQGYPKAVVPWGDGALVMHSGARGDSNLSASPGELGTQLEAIAADGTVTVPDLGIAKTFLGWSASSDGTTLSILGTRGSPGSAQGLVVLRGKRGEPLVEHTLAPGRLDGLEWVTSTVHEVGGSALALPPSSLTAPWRPLGAVYRVSGEVERRVVPVGGPSCYVKSALALGDELWVARECLSDEVKSALVRVPRQGAPSIVALPSIAVGPDKRYAKASARAGALPCFPKALVLRGRDDVFVQARCGSASATADEGVPAVFRRGRAQAPIELP